MMPDALDKIYHGKSESHPMIYAYSDMSYPGLLKVGYTAVDVDKRVAQQYPIKLPGGKVPYKIVYRESAMYADGGSFSDHEVHAALKSMGVECVGGEWFKCDAGTVKAAVITVRHHLANLEGRTETFPMRPEQEQAVNKTMAYFKSVRAEGNIRAPKFLWNAKMRFGKTFASYQLAKKMGMKRVLVMTFKPAVETAWRDDLMRHVDFNGWQFISRPSQSGDPLIDAQYAQADKSRPIVCFGSFQDFLGYDKETGSIKSHHEWVHATNWDLVIFDEYHFGAWKESARKLFEQDEDDIDDEDLSDYQRGDAVDETWLPITTDYYLFLSGTPFRALNSGEFIEEQIYNWTYSDEQRAKENWTGADNPYESLPRMVMLTYRMPQSIERIARAGEFDEFDLNLFFSAEGKGKNAHFKYEDYVQKWLDLIRGAFKETAIDELKLGAEKPPMPYSDTRLMSALNHTLWFMPNVASCYAMANLLAQRQNVFYHKYKVNVCAGSEAGIGAAALEPVQKSMEDPLESQTITLSCGKLTTGVTIKPWTGIFMLRNLSSPETYFQAAFRVQSPWVITTDNGTKEIIKRECYVFDFALNRALRQISDYSCKLSVDNVSPEVKVGEFIKFLPVLAYDGSAMRQVNAGEILDFTMSGTTATLLAKRWESALLVNVDNETLTRLMANKQAMDALMRIEGFRSLNEDIQTIINKSEAVKKAKKEGKKLTPKEKKELSEEEKEYKSKRKMIQEKLIKFATRIPVFMYLTDFREETLQDVITKLEPELFHKVTGLYVDDFELLTSLNVFNKSLMNDAVYKFRRYEDASLEYTGINKHKGEGVGLFSTVLSAEDYEKLNRQLTASQVADLPSVYDLPEKPYSADDSGDDDEEEEEPKQPIKKPTQKVEPRPAIVSGRASIPQKPDFRHAYIAPQPVRVAEPAKRFNVEELRQVVPGSIVIHKAFGEGTVLGFTNSRDGARYISVQFGKLKKEFGFPNAFSDGFLKIKE